MRHLGGVRGWEWGQAFILKVQGARTPYHGDRGCRGWRRWGETRTGALPGASTIGEGRDAESWLQSVAGRVNGRSSSDTESLGVSGKWMGMTKKRK